MSTLVLLDTNAYLRLAKRVRPFVGRQFGQKPYVITILKAVEDEVHAGARLKFKYPWFDNDEFATERLAKAIKLSAPDRKSMEIAVSFAFVGADEVALGNAGGAVCLTHVVLDDRVVGALS